MTPILLDPEEQQQIERLLESTDPQVRRNARLVLTYHHGAPTRQVALEVGLSRSQTRHYRHLFEVERMGMFSSPLPVSEEEDQASPRGAGEREEAEPVGEGLETLPSPLHSSLSTWEGAGSEAEQPPSETAEEREARRAAKKVLKRAKKQARRAAEAAAAELLTSSDAAALRLQGEPEADEIDSPSTLSPLPLGEGQETLPSPSGGDAEGEGEISLPAPLPSPGMLPDDTLAEAGRKTLLFHFAEMLRNEEGTLLGEDIEALHDMRVATRRMRAAMDVFGPAYKPKTVQKHLRGLRLAGRALGRVRDLDVFIEKAERYALSLEPAQRPLLDPLLQNWRSERELDRFELIAHLSSKAHTRFIQEFNRFVQTPGLGVEAPSPQTLATTLPAATLVRHVAPTLIYTRLAAVRAFDAILPSASVPQLHLLRIEFKKLRYTLEFFQEVLGPEARPVISAIKKIQDHLGDLQDAEVACQRLRMFLDQWDQQQVSLTLGERQNPAGIVTYLAERHTERFRLITTFPPVWQSFNSPELQHSLAMAISIL